MTSERMYVTQIDSRSFDRLEMTRLSGLHSGGLQLGKPDSESFPYVCLYAISGTGQIRLGGSRSALNQGELAILRHEPGLALSTSEDSDLLIVKLPKGPCQPYASLFDEQVGVCWDGATGGASLAVGFLDSFVRQFDSYRTGHPARFALTLVGVLGLMCVDGERDSSEPTVDAILDSVRAFIDANLADTQLNPELIASAQHVSTRTLHRLFERRGSTISGWIRNERLERCRLDLTDPRLAHLRVSEIGARSGLWDAAHFSRIFKQAYGQSPRMYRRANSGTLSAAASRVTQELREVA